MQLKAFIQRNSFNPILDNTYNAKSGKKLDDIIENQVNIVGVVFAYQLVLILLSILLGLLVPYLSNFYQGWYKKLTAVALNKNKTSETLLTTFAGIGVILAIYVLCLNSLALNNYLKNSSVLKMISSDLHHITPVIFAFDIIFIVFIIIMCVCDFVSYCRVHEWKTVFSLAIILFCMIILVNHFPFITIAFLNDPYHAGSIFIFYVVSFLLVLSVVELLVLTIVKKINGTRFTDKNTNIIRIIHKGTYLSWRKQTDLKEKDTNQNNPKRSCLSCCSKQSDLEEKGTRTNNPKRSCLSCCSKQSDLEEKGTRTNNPKRSCLSCCSKQSDLEEKSTKKNNPQKTCLSCCSKQSNSRSKNAEENSPKAEDLNTKDYYISFAEWKVEEEPACSKLKSPDLDPKPESDTKQNSAKASDEDTQDTITELDTEEDPDQNPQVVTNQDANSHLKIDTRPVTTGSAPNPESSAKDNENDLVEVPKGIILEAVDVTVSTVDLELLRGKVKKGKLWNVQFEVKPDELKKFKQRCEEQELSQSHKNGDFYVAVQLILDNKKQISADGKCKYESLYVKLTKSEEPEKLLIKEVELTNSSETLSLRQRCMILPCMVILICLTLFGIVFTAAYLVVIPINGSISDAPNRLIGVYQTIFLLLGIYIGYKTFFKRKISLQYVVENSVKSLSSDKEIDDNRWSLMSKEEKLAEFYKTKAEMIKSRAENP